jgi:hypothetical protein
MQLQQQLLCPQRGQQLRVDSQTIREWSGATELQRRTGCGKVIPSAVFESTASCGHIVFPRLPGTVHAIVLVVVCSSR